jgi:hypothetical protein
MSGEMSDQAPPVLAFLFSGAYEKEFTPFKKTSQLLSSSLTLGTLIHTEGGAWGYPGSQKDHLTPGAALGRKGFVSFSERSKSEDN